MSEEIELTIAKQCAVLCPGCAQGALLKQCSGGELAHLWMKPAFGIGKCKAAHLLTPYITGWTEEGANAIYTGAMQVALAATKLPEDAPPQAGTLEYECENEMGVIGGLFGPDYYESEDVRKLAKKADAQITALTEKLRAVEAERDVLNDVIAHCATAVGAAVSPQCSLAFKAQLPGEITLVLSALRAELQRKDAALRAERQCAESFSEQFAECQWVDMGGYFEVRGPVALMLDSEFAEQAYVARRAALQPKEPPCPTA